MLGEVESHSESAGMSLSVRSDFMRQPCGASRLPQTDLGGDEHG